MRRLRLILALSLMPAPVLALPGDGRVRITERTPPAAARPARYGGEAQRSSPRPRRAQRRRSHSRGRPALQAAARPSPADDRQGWQLLGSLADGLRAMSEAWFEAREETGRGSAGLPGTRRAPSAGEAAEGCAAVREEAQLLARVLAFCRRQAPSRPAEQTAWRRACDELLSVARDCAAEPAAHPPGTPHPIAVTRRPSGDVAGVPVDDPLQRLERMDDAVARAQEIVGRYLPAP
jgi:hypothetical protein